MSLLKSARAAVDHIGHPSTRRAHRHVRRSEQPAHRRRHRAPARPIARAPQGRHAAARAPHRGRLRAGVPGRRRRRGPARPSGPAVLPATGRGVRRGLRRRHARGVRVRRHARGADPVAVRADAPAAADALRAAAHIRDVPRVGQREIVSGRRPAQRLLPPLADAGFSLAPALVLIALGAQLPRWEALPVYVMAFAAQFLVDGAAAVAREWLSSGTHPRELAGEVLRIYQFDALITPIGLLAAVAAADAPAAALLVLPLVALLAVFAREREGRITQTIELSKSYRGTALLLRDLLEEDDEYTGHHTEDVVDLSVRVAEQLGVGEDVKRETELGALLHDIGKIHIPDAIINKPGPLDDAEWALMKTHTVEGQKMLDQVGGLLSNVGLVVRASHERFDGRGYPDGLAGEEIPLAARIVAVCDSFNAMTTTRSYRPGMPVATAADEVRRCAGSQFDPAVADALLAVIGDPGWQLTLREPAPAPTVAVRA